MSDRTAMRRIQRELDRGERDAKAVGCADTLTATAQLQGFADWPDVVRCAREGHAFAVELLCRRVERMPAEAP